VNRLYVIDCGHDDAVELWINHDAAQSRLQKRSPQYYD
jgi:hypothetical protein